MSVTFTTTIESGGGNTTGIPVPPEAVAALGAQKTPKVRITLNGYTWRGSVQVWQGRSMIALSSEHRSAAGVQAGDQVELKMELDNEPREVETPEDLTAAMAAVPGARERFDSLSFSKRKEMVRQVESAKTVETRNKRIASVVSSLEVA
jgi:hypothetical protein